SAKGSRPARLTATLLARSQSTAPELTRLLVPPVLRGLRLAQVGDEGHHRRRDDGRDHEDHRDPEVPNDGEHAGDGSQRAGGAWNQGASLAMAAWMRSSSDGGAVSWHRCLMHFRSSA